MTLLYTAAIVPHSSVEKDYKYAKQVNYNGTKNIVDSLIKHQRKPKKFFLPQHHTFIKLEKIFEDRWKSKVEPYSKYGKTKLLQKTI